MGRSIPDWQARLALWSSGGVVRLDRDTVAGWRVDDRARVLLTEVGLPSFGYFRPGPQRAGEPVCPPYYLLGREPVGNHPHGASLDPDCGCGHVGISAVDGAVRQLFRGRDPLPVNSDVTLFFYFLDKVGGSLPTERDFADRVRERKAVRRAEAVMRRLVHRDPILTSGAESFWGYLFARPWG
ncbi:hypothetical protein ADL15_50595 [Actinoplanes awajinensis subsp. mycoplanecinus]|uniref:Uncharacterized protein n=2 Tax=Actinoplanes awajinensis TaxID=135946 RepID=A0A101J788_9ACTN|nr:hypothetical protein ADL15_50595 [Actinoplanes awajinensis subsp. mycoplanecinus]